MKHKTIAQIALFMAAVFFIIVIVYPMLFNPNTLKPEAPIPATEPMAPAVPPPAPTGP